MHTVNITDTTVNSAHLLEDVCRRQQLRVNLCGREEALAHHENLSGRVTGRVRLGRIDGLEQLVEDPQQGVVVGRSEDLSQDSAGWTSTVTAPDTHQGIALSTVHGRVLNSTLPWSQTAHRGAGTPLQASARAASARTGAAVTHNQRTVVNYSSATLPRDTHTQNCCRHATHLAVRVLDPRCTDVGGAVVQYDISLCHANTHTPVN